MYKNLFNANLSIPFNAKRDFKYLGAYMNIEKESEARARAIYAATNCCCSSTDFKPQFCSEHVGRINFKTYVYETLCCLSSFEDVPQCLKTSFPTLCPLEVLR